MTVFKNYLKVTKSFLPVIIAYTVIFVGIATLTSTSGAQNSQTFEASEANIAIINHDEESEFIQTFREYVKGNAKLIELEDQEDQLRDALFFRKVDYIMIIPKDFTKDFLNNENVKIETMDVPDSTSSIYSKSLMNKYLNTAKLYLNTDISLDLMLKNIQQDLSIHTAVDFQSATPNGKIQNAALFYNFSNYTLLAIIIMVVSMVMISFHDEKIKRRNLVSSLSYKSLNRQLLLGNIVVTFGVWLLYVVASIALYGETMFTNAGLLLMFNSFVFVIFILVLSFFLTTLTDKREVVSGISNVVGLGTSFIAGAFVPQEFLSEFVLNIAKLIPSYWFISNNNYIAKLTSFGWIDLQPFFMNMGVVIGFIVLFYILIQFISRWKLKK